MVDFWFRDGRWWHLLIVGTALANTVVAGSVAAFAATESERSEALVATGALLLIPVVWLAFGVRSLTDPRRGAALILLVSKYGFQDVLTPDLVAACDAIIPSLVERDPEWAGWCSVLVNINDLSAMGAVPSGLLDAVGECPQLAGPAGRAVTRRGDGEAAAAQGACDVGGAVAAAVVDEDQPQRPGVALGEQRGQRFRQDPGLVAGGHDDRHGGPRGGRPPGR